jgi:hypothetical protein
MIAVTFPQHARTAVDECLARPYPSATAGGEILVEDDMSGRQVLVLIDVPTGLGVDALVDQVADDVKNELVSGLRALHNESSDSRTRLVFTPARDADLESLTRDLRVSFERTRSATETVQSRIRAKIADQGLAVALPDDDWFIVHDMLDDARTRRPTDIDLAEAAHLVDVSLFGDEDE